MNTKVYHEVHGQGTVSNEIFESSTDSVKVEFKEGSKVVKKTELKKVFHS